MPGWLPSHDLLGFAAAFHIAGEKEAMGYFYDHKNVQVRKMTWSANSRQGLPLILKFRLHFADCESNCGVL